MNNKINNFYSGVLIFLKFAIGIIGFGLHLWTVYLLYFIHGFFGSLISLFFPIISQIYLMIISYQLSGTFLTTYNTAIVTYVISGIIINILLAKKISYEENNY